MKVKDRIEKTLEEIVERIQREYDPEKIILFGSYAWGKPTEESDIDLLIVKDTSKPFHKRWAEVCQIVSELRRGLALSPFVITPSELSSRLEIGDQFFEEIIERGKILYAR
ncbi:MAG: nucleotidyltransferase domain-containing protein [Candidatus Brocadiales bacterium]